MNTGDVAYLHDGTAVLVVDGGSGTPGEADYVPAVAARLMVEEFEPEQLTDTRPEPYDPNAPVAAAPQGAAQVAAANVSQLSDAELEAELTRRGLSTATAVPEPTATPVTATPEGETPVTEPGNGGTTSTEPIAGP